MLTSVESAGWERFWDTTSDIWFLEPPELEENWVRIAAVGGLFTWSAPRRWKPRFPSAESLFCSLGYHMFFEKTTTVIPEKTRKHLRAVARWNLAGVAISAAATAGHLLLLVPALPEPGIEIFAFWRTSLPLCCHSAH